MDNAYLLTSKDNPDGYMSPEDSLLDGFTMKQVMDAVTCGEPTISPDSVRKVFNDMLKVQVQDARAILEANMDTIIDSIKRQRGEDDDPSYDPDWADKADCLANDIYKLLIKYDLWVDVSIYYNGKRMSCMYTDENGKTRYDYNGQPHIEDGYDPRDYFHYVRRPNILSMSFESDLYDVINYSENPKFMREFNRLLDSYGLYYELGNAWNLTVTEK